MVRKLRIEDITSGSPVEVGILGDSAVQIGREPESGLRLASPAASRTHGIFFPVRNYWFYKDLGSTNGSWINDVQSFPSQIRQIRPEDLLQIADVVLKLSDVNKPEMTGDPFLSHDPWSLIVFSNGEFVDEYPIPRYGKALIVGGKEGDLPFSDAQFQKTHENPSIVFERRKNSIYVFRVETEPMAVLNGQEISHSTPLSDRDRVEVGNFLILFNCPPVPSREVESDPPQNVGEIQPKPDPGNFQTGADPLIRGWAVSSVLEDSFAKSQEGEKPAVSHRSLTEGRTATQIPKVPSQPQPSVEKFQAMTTQVFPSAYTRRPFPGSVSPRQSYGYDEESPSIYRILIYVFAVICIILLTAITILLVR